MAFDRLKTTGGTPQIGGELPPLDGMTAPAAPKMSLKQYAQSLIDSGRWGGGTLGPAQLMAFLMNGGVSKSAKDKKPGTTTTKPPTTPAQWAFKPSPYDQPNYAVPMGNAAQYTINPPAQQWMFDPATGGQGAPPQWYGQPVVPNSQPPIR